MSTADDRLQAIKDNYIDAIQNQSFDLANAKTVEQVNDVLSNIRNAATAFYEAVASVLTQNSANVEQAYQSAVSARRAVVEARQRSEEIPALIGKLKTSTEKAKQLLEQAKS